MKTKLRSLLRCVPLEERVVPASGGSDPFQFMLGSFAARGGWVNPYDIDVPPAADGSITFPGADQHSGDAAVQRLNADGSNMLTFGDNGVVVVPFFSDPALNTTYDYFSAAQVLPDGSVIASGVAGPESANGIRSFMTVRFSSTGQLDPTFGVNGRSIITPIGSTFEPVDLVVMANGSIAILGNQSYQIAVTLLDPNGAIVPTFGQNGYYKSSIDIPTGQIDVQPLTNRLVISFGQQAFYFGRIQMGVLALTPSGQTDLSFGNQGVAALDTPISSRVGSMFIRSDGVITLIGSGFLYQHDLSAVSDLITASQFTIDGQPDNDFGLNGFVSTPLPAQNITQTTFPPAFQIGALRGTANSFLVYSHAVPTPQDFYVESGFNSVTRIQSFGQVDLSFGNKGTAPVDFVPNVASHSEPFAIEFTPQLSDFQISGAGGGSGALVTQDENGILSTAGVSPFFPVFEGPIRTVTADVNGDGVPDLIGGSGPGGGPHVIVIDGKTKFRMAEFFAFEQSFTGGINVTAGDLNGDGKAEIIVTPDRGGGPIVAVYDGAKLADGFNNDAQLTRFFGIDDKNFRGGARVAVGDVSGDGTADLLVSAGFEGGPRIALFDGTGIAPGTTPPPKLRPDFFAFEPSLRNGAYVTLGDLNGDGQAELVFGGGPGGSPRVRLFDGKGLLAAGSFKSLDEIPDAQLANFFAADANRRGGIRLAIKEINGSPALLAASGENEAAQLRVFPAATLLGSANPQPTQILDLFDGAVLADGVFVG